MIYKEDHGDYNIYLDVNILSYGYISITHKETGIMCEKRKGFLTNRLISNMVKEISEILDRALKYKKERQGKTIISSFLSDVVGYPEVQGKRKYAPKLIINGYSL